MAICQFEKENYFVQHKQTLSAKYIHICNSPRELTF